jgi:hypothetical protein
MPISYQDRESLMYAIRAFVAENPFAHLVVARLLNDAADPEVTEVPPGLQLTALGHTGWDILSQRLDEQAMVHQRDDTRAAVLWHVHGGKVLRWWPTS